MDITEIRVKLVEDYGSKLIAYCSIVLAGELIIKDLKVVRGTRGTFVAMPSKKICDACPGCRGKNHLTARFCNSCGEQLDPERATSEGRAKLHADLTHPITQGCRDRLQSAVLAAVEEEKFRASKPGYTCRYDECA